MSNSLADLDAAIAAATVTANDVNISAQTNLSAVNAAANRVLNLPSGPTDFTSQVNAVNAISDQLAATKSLVDSSIAVANNIAP